MTSRTINHQIRVQGGEEARREIVRLGDTQEAQDRRVIASAEAKNRRMEAAERQYLAAKAEAIKAQGRADTVLGPGGFTALQEQERAQIRAAETARIMAREQAAQMKEQEALSARALVLAREMGRERQEEAGSYARLMGLINPLWAAEEKRNQTMQEALRLRTAGMIGEEQYRAALMQSKAALDAATLAQGKHGATLGWQRAAYLQLGFQIQDITQSVALGVPAMTILAQQAGQTASAIGLATGGQAAKGGLKGALAATAGFLSGPWGAAVMGGAMILGVLLTKTQDVKKAQEEQESAAKKQAQALEALDRITGRLNKTEEQQVAIGMRLTMVRVEQASATLKLVEAELARAEQLARLQANDNTPAGTADEQIAREADARRTDATIGDLKKKADDLRKQLNEDADRLRSGAAYLVRTEALRNADKSASELERHRLAMKTLEDQYKANGNQAAYSRGVVEETKRHEAAAEAAKKHGAAIKETSKDMLTLAQIRGGVLDAFPGAAITATTNGKHVKGSDHYKGRAIDFVPEGGAGAYSKDQVRARLQAQGLQIRVNDQGVEQLFGPGDPGHATHWHAAFSGGKGAVDAMRDMQQMAEELDRLKGRFDPVHAAMVTYRDDLDAIARLEQAGGMDRFEAGAARQKAGKDFANAKSDAFYQSIGVDVKAEYQAQIDAANDNIDLENERRDSIRAVNAELKDRTEFMQFELSIMDQGDGERRRSMALHERINDLKRDGVILTEAEIADLRKQTDAWVKITEEVEKAQAVQDDFRRIGESALDSLFDVSNWKNWGDIGNRVLRELANEFIMLAALNPLKNALYGSSLPTLGGLGGLFGGSSSIVEGDGANGLEKIMGLVNMGRNALGTERFGGGLTVVGENGPEIAALPERARIMPAAASRQLLAGGGAVRPAIVVHQNLTVPVGLDLATKAEVGQMAEAVYSATLSAVAEERRRAA